jgi:hypothetical protein
MVFDVKYDLRHEARLVAGVNWTKMTKRIFIQEFSAWILKELGFS